MHVTIINPNIVTQKGDFFGTGIPYMPIIPAYLASYLRSRKNDVDVVDAFGEAPKQRRKEGDKIISGLTLKQVGVRIKPKTDLICIYAGHIVEHDVIIQILSSVKRIFKQSKVLVFENPQAVTAYSLKIAHKEFFKKGVDYVVYGDPEETINKLMKKRKLLEIEGLIYKKKNKIIVNKPYTPKKSPDQLPIPAWDLFNLNNYWKLGYAHVPYRKKYLPLLTSRGCPYQCEFCIIPYTNRRVWRARSPENLIDEIKTYMGRFGVKEFHIEDLNPTLDTKRIKDFCKQIIDLDLDIIFKFASGIKLETVDKETLEILYEAGCRYISFSPESGSDNVLKLMKKPFDHQHGLKMTKVMHKLGIVSQACFVLGFPGENDKDRQMTKQYAAKLTKNGLDEVAFFVMTPSPGSKPFESSQIKEEDLSRLTFSPKWRKEYKVLHEFRKQAYISFLLNKIRSHPFKLMIQPFCLIFRKFRTKMEMTVYRVINQYI